VTNAPEKDDSPCAVVESLTYCGHTILLKPS
jgi:hypothetical protein